MASEGVTSEGVTSERVTSEDKANEVAHIVGGETHGNRFVELVVWIKVRGWV